jgi:hypothetical protein
MFTKKDISEAGTLIRFIKEAPPSNIFSGQPFDPFINQPSLTNRPPPISRGQQPPVLPLPPQINNYSGSPKVNHPSHHDHNINVPPRNQSIESRPMQLETTRGSPMPPSSHFIRAIPPPLESSNQGVTPPNLAKFTGRAFPIIPPPIDANKMVIPPNLSKFTGKTLIPATSQEGISRSHTSPELQTNGRPSLQETSQETNKKAAIHPSMISSNDQPSVALYQKVPVLQQGSNIDVVETNNEIIDFYSKTSEVPYDIYGSRKNHSVSKSGGNINYHTEPQKPLERFSSLNKELENAPEEIEYDDDETQEEIMRRERNKRNFSVILNFENISFKNGEMLPYLAPPRRTQSSTKNGEVSSGNVVSKQGSHSPKQSISEGSKRVSGKVLKSIDIRIYIENASMFKTVRINELQRAKDVVNDLKQKANLDISKSWALFELINDAGIERPIRNFEIVTDVLSTWGTTTTNALLIKNYGYNESLNSKVKIIN